MNGYIRCDIPREQNIVQWYKETSYQLQIDMENKGILLSKRSQSKKAKYCMFPTIYYSGKGKTMQTIKKISSCQGLRRRER